VVSESQLQEEVDSQTFSSLNVAFLQEETWDAPGEGLRLLDSWTPLTPLT
jgi:hypothetical protein